MVWNLLLTCQKSMSFCLDSLSYIQTNICYLFPNILLID